MKGKIFLILIILLGFTLRFWQLGVNPISIDWDEVSLGYNAYSLLKTAKDEYGNFLPLSIRSFGDYKPPLYTYLSIFPVYIFGLNEFSIRFISAFLGSLTVIVGYYLVKELFPNKSTIYYLLLTIFLAVSPWHIQFSRQAFEANTALFFLICGILFFLKGIKKGRYFFVSSIFFALSLYSYHSPKLIVPLLIVGLTFIYRKEVKGMVGSYLLGMLILFLLTFPITKEFSSSVSARFGSVSVVNPNERLGASIQSMELDQKRGDILGKLMHNRRIVYGREVLAGYLDHFNFDFLFLTGDAPGRHHAASMGMLYFWDFPFILLGILYLLKKFDKSIKALLLWFLIAPTASALTTGTPHAVRALFYLPTYQIFTVFGVIETVEYLKLRLSIKSVVRILLVIFFVFTLNFFYYLHMYYIHTPIEYASWWQYGYKQVVEEVSKLEVGRNKVIVTYRYDQPYIYFLFYKKIDPSWYQQNWGHGEIMRSERKFGKYEFRNLNWKEDEKLTNVILVGTGDEIPDSASGIVKNIYLPDGSVAFRIVAR